MHGRHAALLCLGTCLLLAPSASEAQNVTITGTLDSKRSKLAPRQDAGSLTTAFTLLPGERTSVTFGTTEPGTVMVVVQVKGQPLIVTVLDGKGALVAQQGGTGSITFPLQLPTATSQDQNFWVVSMRDSRDTVPPTVALRSVPRPVSSGTVTVSGPVMSAQDFANMMAPRIAAAERAAAAVPRSRKSAPVVIDMAPARAVLAQQVAQAQQAQLSAIAPRLPAAATAQMKQRIDLRARGDVPQQMIVSGGGATTALAGGVVRRAPVTASVSQAADGAAPVGTAGGAGAGAVAAAPVITNLSVRQGPPGTPLLLEGSGFGDQAGEVRFMIAGGIDLASPFAIWSNTQVFAEVPVKEGVQAFNGYVYVKRADGSKTALVPFGFLPTTDVVTFCVADNENDVRLAAPLRLESKNPLSVRHFLFWGAAGYDEVNLQQRLMNGWRVSAVQIRDSNCAALGATRENLFGIQSVGAGAYVSEWREGTDSPYVKVRWWADPLGNQVTYTVAITVTGPKGLPFR
jgi:hypothetical protein